MAYDRFEQWDLQCDLEKAKTKKKVVKRSSGDGIAAQYGLKPPSKEAVIPRKRIEEKLNNLVAEKNAERTKIKKKKVEKEEEAVIPKKRIEEKLNNLVAEKNAERTKIKKKKVEKVSNDKNDYEEIFRKDITEKSIDKRSALASREKEKAKPAILPKTLKRRSSSASSKNKYIRKLDNQLANLNDESLPPNKMKRIETWIESHFTDSDDVYHETDNDFDDFDDNDNEHSVDLESEVEHKKLSKNLNKKKSIVKSSSQSQSPMAKNSAENNSISVENGFDKKHFDIKQKNSRNKDSSRYVDVSKNVSPVNKTDKEKEKTSKRIRPVTFNLAITAVGTCTQTDITGPIFEKLCNGDRELIDEEEHQDNTSEQQHYPHYFKVDLKHDQYCKRIVKPVYDKKKNDLQPWFEHVIDQFSPKLLTDPKKNYNCFLTVCSRFLVMREHSMDYIELLPEIPSEGNTWWNNEQVPRIHTSIQRETYRSVLTPELVNNIPDLLITRIYSKIHR